MWFAIWLFPIALIIAAVGALSGGAFLIILLPIAIVVAIFAVFSLVISRKTGLAAADGGASGTVTRFGHESESGINREPATPEELLKARQGGSTPGVG
jgi:hypothetical protein